MKNNNITAADAMRRLKEGNAAYLNSRTGCGDVSPEIRIYTVKSGQKPYAVIIACSDSRGIPEYIFSAGIGDLFVIRVAGNVIDNNQLGSIEYAVERLADCRGDLRHRKRQSRIRYKNPGLFRNE